MRTPLLLAALLPLVGGCATLTTDRLPFCDDQARRPANPYGSVLLPPAQPDPASDPENPSEHPIAHATGGCA